MTLMKADSMFKPVNWKAKWIWYPEAREEVNFYFFARKEFKLTDDILDANLHISAHTDYMLFVNGRFIGRGPNPSDPYHFYYYDTYIVKDFLRRGKNTIAIICHNYGVGVHFQPVYPGNLPGSHKKGQYRPIQSVSIRVPAVQSIVCIAHLTG